MLPKNITQFQSNIKKDVAEICRNNDLKLSALEQRFKEQIKKFEKNIDRIKAMHMNMHGLLHHV